MRMEPLVPYVAQVFLIYGRSRAAWLLQEDVGRGEGHEPSRSLLSWRSCRIRPGKACARISLQDVEACTEAVVTCQCPQGLR